MDQKFGILAGPGQHSVYQIFASRHEQLRVLRQLLRQVGHKRLHQRQPAKLLGLQEDHPATGNRGRRRIGQVLHLEHHRHPICQLDDLSTRQAELLVVVQDSVHVLNPYCVHGPVEDHPLALSHF
jgi:hypothetical protein